MTVGEKYIKIDDIINNLGEGTKKGLDTVKRIITNMTSQINEKEFKILDDIVKQKKNNIKKIILNSDESITGTIGFPWTLGPMVSTMILTRDRCNPPHQIHR